MEAWPVVGTKMNLTGVADERILVASYHGGVVPCPTALEDGSEGGTQYEVG